MYLSFRDCRVQRRNSQLNHKIKVEMTSAMSFLFLFMFCLPMGKLNPQFPSCFPFCEDEEQFPDCFPFCDSHQESHNKPISFHTSPSTTNPPCVTRPATTNLHVTARPATCTRTKPVVSKSSQGERTKVSDLSV